MQVIDPERYQQRPQRTGCWSRGRLIALAIAVLVVIAGFVNYARPLPAPAASLDIKLPAAQPVSLAWPDGGQSAVAAQGYGTLGTNGDQTPLATASITKVIAALCVLQKQPLKLGQTGPTFTVRADDVATYQKYVAEDGSLIPVQQGEQLTEYQALQALLIPSANNIADSLVRWVFGSQQAYASYALSFLQQHKLAHTHIGPDASGFDPGTTSTAADLTQLGLLALKDPVLMQIAGQRTADLPVVGTVSNYDAVLGVNGITGLKTGNNDADPGAFLFTANKQVGDQTIELTGAVMGAPDLGTALHESAQLAASLGQGFEQTTVLDAGQTAGTLRGAWGASVPIVAAREVQVVRWKTTPLSVTHQLHADGRSGVIGSLKVTAGKAAASAALQVKQPLPGPSFWWRLTRH